MLCPALLPITTMSEPVVPVPAEPPIAVMLVPAATALVPSAMAEVPGAEAPSVPPVVCTTSPAIAAAPAVSNTPANSKCEPLFLPRDLVPSEAATQAPRASFHTDR